VKNIQFGLNTSLNKTTGMSCYWVTGLTKLMIPFLVPRCVIRSMMNTCRSLGSVPVREFVRNRRNRRPDMISVVNLPLRTMWGNRC
jgi:hypothetical protein